MKRVMGIVVSIALISAVAVFAAEDTTWGKIKASTEAPAPASKAANKACWGQASAVFAQLGEMGLHSSSQGNPRAGLRNLARNLADAGYIPDDTMESLGQFVATSLNLSIEACGTDFPDP